MFLVRAPASNPLFLSSSLPGTRLHVHIQACLELPSNKKKGFGKSQPLSNKPSKQQQGDSAEKKKALLLNQDSQELQSVIKSVEKDSSKKHSRRFNIDKDVAARGKVDFVKVESWGDEAKEQSELDHLKVKSFSPSYSSSDINAPFYEKLVHRLQLLESKGDISVVQAQSLPKFQDWAFGEERYLQYLIDQHAVFEVLKFGIASIQDSNKISVSLTEEASLGKAALAVKIFDDTLGLDRTEALRADINALFKEINTTNDKFVEFPKPTTQTTAYVKYLKQLAGVAACNDDKLGKQACLRVLAHIFAVYVTHLTTGMRIGAKALDCMSVLKEAKAVRFYRDYPQFVADPLKVFIAAMNKVTDFVSTNEEQEMVMEELPKAIQKTSLLLVLLAVTEHTRKDVPGASVAVA